MGLLLWLLWIEMSKTLIIERVIGTAGNEKYFDRLGFRQDKMEQMDRSMLHASMRVYMHPCVLDSHCYDSTILRLLLFSYAKAFLREIMKYGLFIVTNAFSCRHDSLFFHYYRYVSYSKCDISLTSSPALSYLALVMYDHRAKQCFLFKSRMLFRKHFEKN